MWLPLMARVSDPRQVDYIIVHMYEFWLNRRYVAELFTCRWVSVAWVPTSSGGGCSSGSSFDRKLA